MIQHVTEQPNPCITTIEPVLQNQETATAEPHATAAEPVYPGAWALQREATAIRSPHATTREEPLLTTTRARPMQQQRPNRVKNEQIYKINLKSKM